MNISSMSEYRTASSSIETEIQEQLNMRILNQIPESQSSVGCDIGSAVGPKECLNFVRGT
jgi:hypothetical protein